MPSSMQQKNFSRYEVRTVRAQKSIAFLKINDGSTVQERFFSGEFLRVLPLSEPIRGNKALIRPKKRMMVVKNPFIRPDFLVPLDFQDFVPQEDGGNMPGKFIQTGPQNKINLTNQYSSEIG